MTFRPLALGMAAGVVSSASVLLATVRAAQVDGGQTLLLLRKFFPGYSISPSGCGLGMVWGFVYAFVAAGSFALLYNLFCRMLEPRPK